MEITGADHFLDEARRTVPELSAAEAKARLDAGEAILVDVRDAGEWQSGRVPGAILAPRGILEWMADPACPNHLPALVAAVESPVILQCAHGFRSLLAGQTLQQMGFKDVASLTGGFEAWEQAGYPVER